MKSGTFTNEAYRLNLHAFSRGKECLKLSAFHLAFMGHQLKIVRMFLEHRFNPSLSTHEVGAPAAFMFARTALKILRSDEKRTIAILQLMLDNGWDINVRLTKAGTRMLHIACDLPQAYAFLRTAIVQYPLDNNANVHCESDHGVTALHVAALSSESPNTISFLLRDEKTRSRQVRTQQHAG